MPTSVKSLLKRRARRSRSAAALRAPSASNRLSQSTVWVDAADGRRGAREHVAVELEVLVVHGLRARDPEQREQRNQCNRGPRASAACAGCLSAQESVLSSSTPPRPLVGSGGATRPQAERAGGGCTLGSRRASRHPFPFRVPSQGPVRSTSTRALFSTKLRTDEGMAVDNGRTDGDRPIFGRTAPHVGPAGFAVGAG